MSDGMPPGGWPMRMAITALVTERWRHNASLYLQLEPSSSAADLRTTCNGLWNELVGRACNDEVVFFGAPPTADRAGPIDPSLLRGAEPDYDADTLTAGGRFFHAVTVYPAPDVPQLERPAQPTSNRGKGGRKQVHDWTAFAAEVVRIGWQDGFKTRRLLTAQMREWCAKEWASPPDDETVRKKVAELCPADVPPD